MGDYGNWPFQPRVIATDSAGQGASVAWVAATEPEVPALDCGGDRPRPAAGPTPSR